MVSFAEEQRQEGHDGFASSSQAGFTRFRPVIMTALAMIIGMLPMATGLGEGGSANAPFGQSRDWRADCSHVLDPVLRSGCVLTAQTFQAAR